MATKYVDLKGKVKWAKIWKPDEKYGKYSIDISPDEESRKIIDGLNLKNGYKVDNTTGEEYITFRRDPSHTVFTGKDQRGPAGAPRVLGVEPNTPVGNYSECTIRLAVYAYDNKFGKGTGTRLEAVNVTKLEEYSKGETQLDSPF